MININNLLGKTLLFIHLGMSLVLMTIAFGLYTNRIDWTSNAAKPDQAAGLLAQRDEEYKSVTGNALRPADTRYHNQQVKLETQEQRRPGEQVWYVAEKEHLATKAAEGNFCRRVKRDAGQRPTPRTPTKEDPSYLEMEKPKDLNGNDVDLQSLIAYERKCQKALDDVKTELAKIIEAAKADEEITKLLSGDKGVHNRMRDEKIKKDLAVLEYRDLRPDWINATIELSNIEILRARLTDRIDELKETIKPKTNP